MKKCNHKKCGYHYCQIQYDANRHRKNQEKLGPDPKTGIWKNTMWVHKPVTLTYCGVCLDLMPDGTYQLGDTTGG